MFSESKQFGESESNFLAPICQFLYPVAWSQIRRDGFAPDMQIPGTANSIEERAAGITNLSDLPSQALSGGRWVYQRESSICHVGNELKGINLPPCLLTRIQNILIAERLSSLSAAQLLSEDYQVLNLKPI